MAATSYKWQTLAVAAIVLLPMADASAQTSKYQTSVTKLFGKIGSDPSPATVFDLVDADKNGTISEDELRFRKMAVFSGRDGDKNGKLTKEEVANFSDPVFAAIDTDGDGTISGYEFNQMKIAKFDAMDANGDGGITMAEFEAFRETINQQ
jgi:Ca2+-binding EF-hand superfamily protein